MNSAAQTPAMTATYAPEDNKLRVYASARLPDDIYATLRDAGFSWAPQQKLFVAPAWTPWREDLAIEYCGQIGDEDTTLAERAAERAERFDARSESRANEASAAREAASTIAGNIPFGQPILVGHHSERRARKDAEKIGKGFRRAVQLWDESDYWQRRAKGALRNAKYKELPAVRARRIKTLEADQRRQARDVTKYTELLALWTVEPFDFNQALRAAHAGCLTAGFSLEDFPRSPEACQLEFPISISTALEDRICSAEQAREIAVPLLKSVLTTATRWFKHYENRIAYERAMLTEQGGLVGEKHDLQAGGRVLIRGEWATILRITKKNGVAISVTTNAKYVPVRGIEEIKAYEAPSAEVAETMASASKLPPLVNYPGDGFLHMTKAEWNSTHKDYKGSRELGQGAQRPGGYRPDLKNADLTSVKHGRHRVRSVVRGSGLQAVFLTDEKRKEPPAPVTAEPAPAVIAPPERVMTGVKAPPAPVVPSEADAVRAQLAHGIEVVAAAQLFPTPAPLAARMVQMAAIRPGEKVLEPEAGTASILREIAQVIPLCEIHVHAVEINGHLVQSLRRNYPGVTVSQCDFMDYDVSAVVDKFDVIVMNPPFSESQDIKHIMHAAGMLAPGGRLIAICANGPRQNAELRNYVEAAGGTWEPLPSGTFATSGTGVNTVLLTIESEN